jgi:putative molybdopterin biosynthesis protein
MVNRQRGAGTRVLLDVRLKQLGVAPEGIRGYDRQVETHTAVAAAIASGSADTGLGILSAARSMELDFVPVGRERYDLAILAARMDLPEVKLLLEAVRSDSYKAVVRELGGYDTTDTGLEVARIESGSILPSAPREDLSPGHFVPS